jgi:hypothetical protein
MEAGRKALCSASTASRRGMGSALDREERTDAVIITVKRSPEATTFPDVPAAALRPTSLKMSMLAAKGAPSTEISSTRDPTELSPLQPGQCS